MATFMETWGSWFVVAGVLLNILGTGLAATVLVQDWREHRGGQPLLPWAHRAWQLFRRVILRRPRQVITGSGNLIAGGFTMEGLGMGYAPLHEGATLDEVVAYLRKEIATVYSTISTVRNDANKRARAASERANEVRNEMLTETRRVEELAREIATGSVRQELFGLVLVGVGTIVGVLPSLPW